MPYDEFVVAYAADDGADSWWAGAEDGVGGVGGGEGADCVSVRDGGLFDDDFG